MLPLVALVGRPNVASPPFSMLSPAPGTRWSMTSPVLRVTVITVSVVSMRTNRS